MKFMVLQAERQDGLFQEIKTALVDWDSWKEMSRRPAAFFPPTFGNAKALGAVEIVGEAADHLDGVYLSDL